MFWMRLLLYLDSVRFFGAMLVVLKVMMKESLIFFALLIVIIVGFLQAFVGMDNADNKTDVCPLPFPPLLSSHYANNLRQQYSSSKPWQTP
jgi:hypothetical protein